MSIKIPAWAVDLQKNRQKYIDIYNNKQSIFLGVDETRKRIFVMKSKPTRSQTKNDILYIPVNLAKVVSQVFTDYEVGGGLDVIFKDDEESQETFDSLAEKLNLEVKIPKLMRKKSYVWYSIARVRTTKEEITEESLRLDVIPAKNYYPSTEGINIGDEFIDLPAHYIISEVKEEVANELKTFSYVDSYIKEGDVWKYKKEKYSTNGEWNSSLFSKIKMGFVFSSPVETMIEEIEIKELPLFLFSNETEDDEDSIIENNVFGQSDYRDIFELLQEYNDRYSQISIEFIKHLESSMSIPQSTVKGLQQQKRLRKVKSSDESGWEEGQLMDNIGKIYSHAPGEQPAHYITKDIQTDKGIERLKQVITSISWITFVPENMFWVKSTTQITATQVIYDNDKFYKKVITRQNQIKNELQRMFWFLVSVLWKKEEVVYPEIEFVLPVPRDQERDSRVYTVLVNSWLVSKKTAIKKVMGYDDKMVELEIEQLEEEQKVNSAIEGTDLPTIE